MLRFLRYAPAYGSSALTSLGLFFAGVFFLLVLFRSKKIVRHLQIWKDRFTHCGVTPEAYTGSVFARSCVVYVRIPLLAVTRRGLVSSTCQTKAGSSKVPKSMFYVGSTAITLSGRDAGRYRRYKQLYGTSAVQAEPAVRYWYLQDNFFDYVSVVLFPCSCAENARVCENVFLQLWRPGLNYPQSNRLVFQSSGVKEIRLLKKHDFVQARPGKRLFLKLRWRLGMVTRHFKQVRLNRTLSREEAWMILHDLMKKDGRAWNMQRSLGSARWTHEHVYALYKLAANLEEPFRSSVRGRIASVLRLRNQDVPRLNQPLVVPFLAHSKFPAFATQWLRGVRCQYQHVLLPFHLPSKTVVEGSHQTVAKFLFSYRQWFTKFEQSPHTSFCMCKHVLSEHPDLDVVEGHIASPAVKLTVPSHLQKLVGCSARSMVFPSKCTYIKQSIKLVKKWARVRRFPEVELCQQWIAFLEEQWPMHMQAAENRFTFRDVCRVRQHLKHLVSQPRSCVSAGYGFLSGSVSAGCVRNF